VFPPGPTETKTSHELRKVARWLNRVAFSLDQKQQSKRQQMTEQAFDSGRAVRIPLPGWTVGVGNWMELERAIGRFSRSNNIDLIRFESTETGLAQVCVWSKDAPVMREFVTLKCTNANHAGAANRSQPVGLQTNRTSAAAGSGR
jgi:hypothetical protein